MSVTGPPGKGPVRVGLAISDLVAGTYLALGIMIALFDREKTGRGRWVTTSLLELTIAMLDFQAARFLVRKEVPEQEGNFHPTATPTGTYPSSDGYINISAAGHRIWDRFCPIIGAPELAKDPRFSSYEGRARNRAELNDIVGEYTIQHPSAYWVETLNAAGVPCGPIYSIDQVFADPQVKHLKMSRETTHSTLGTIELVAQGFNLSGASKDIRLPTPKLGEHSVEVLRELGHSDLEIEELRAGGVI